MNRKTLSLGNKCDKKQATLGSYNFKPTKGLITPAAESSECLPKQGIKKFNYKSSKPVATVLPNR